MDFSLEWLLLLKSIGSRYLGYRYMGSLVVMHGHGVSRKISHAVPMCHNY